MEELLAPRANLARLHPYNLVGQELFSLLLTHEVHKATRLQYSISVLCLTPDAPPRLVGPTFSSRLARVAIGSVRATDVASTLYPSGMTLLFVGAEAANLPAIFHRLTEVLEPIPVETKGRAPQLLTLSGGGGCYPQTASSGDELLDQAVELMHRAKAEGGSRLYLPP